MISLLWGLRKRGPIVHYIVGKFTILNDDDDVVVGAKFCCVGYDGKEYHNKTDYGKASSLK